MPDSEQLNHFLRTGKLTPNACYYFDPPLELDEMLYLQGLFINIVGSKYITNPIKYGIDEPTLLWFETDGDGEIYGWQNPMHANIDEPALVSYDDVVLWHETNNDDALLVNGRVFLTNMVDTVNLFDKLYESFDLSGGSLRGKMIVFDPSATEQNIQDVMDYFDSINVPRGGHYWRKDDVRIVYEDYILKGKNLGIGIGHNGEDLPWGEAKNFKDIYEFIPYAEFLTQVIGFNSHDALDKLYENIGGTQPKVGDYLIAKDNKKMNDSGEQFLTKDKPYRITEVDVSAPPASIVRSIYIDDDQGHNHRLGASFYREHFIFVPESLEDTEGMFNKLYEQEDDSLEWARELIDNPVFRCKDIINDLEAGDEILVSGDFTDDENNVMLSVYREPFIVGSSVNNLRNVFIWVRPIDLRPKNWEEVSTVTTSGANIRIDLNTFPKDGDLEIEIIKKNTHPF